MQERDKTSTQINIKVNIAETMRLNKNLINKKCKFLFVTIAVCLKLVQFKTLVGRSGYVGDTLQRSVSWHTSGHGAFDNELHDNNRRGQLVLTGRPTRLKCMSTTLNISEADPAGRTSFVVFLSWTLPLQTSRLNRSTGWADAAAICKKFRL